jgi:hypothetical protein
MSTRLAKDSARTVVASEQVSAIRASDFSCMLFAFRLNSSADVGNFNKSHPVIFYWASAETLMQINTADGPTTRPSPVVIKRVAYQLSSGSMSSDFTAVNRAMGKAWA